MRDLRLACLALALSGALGCALAHDRSRRGGSPFDEDGDVSPDDDAELEEDWDDWDDDGTVDESDDEDTDLVAPDCARSLPPEDAPRLLARDVHATDVAFGPCGELAYVSAGATHLIDPTFTRELAWVDGNGSEQFSPDGALFMSKRGDATLLYDLERDVRFDLGSEPIGFVLRDATWSSAEPGDAPRSLALACDGSGLGVLVDGVVETRVAGPGCAPDASQRWEILRWGELGSRVVYRDPSDAIRVADLASGEDVQPNLSRAPAGQIPLDILHLSDDGRVLVHVAAWEEGCGDTHCTMSDGLATLLDLRSEELRTTPVLMQPHDTDLRVVKGPPGSHRLALDGFGQMTLLSYEDALVTRHHAGFSALTVASEGRHVLGQRTYDGALQLVPFAEHAEPIEITRSSTGWHPDTPLEVAVSRDGSVVAYGAFRPHRCEVHPELREGCEGQVWEVVVWSRRHGELAAHLTTQPAIPLWVGNEGTVLFEGTLDGDGAGFGSGTFAIRTDGQVQAHFSGSPAQVTGLHDGFLLVENAEVMGAGAALWRFDEASGGAATVAVRPASVPADATLEAWVDREERRLAYVYAWWEDGTRRGELFAGELPAL